MQAKKVTNDLESIEVGMNFSTLYTLLTKAGNEPGYTLEALTNALGKPEDDSQGAQENHRE